MCKCMNTQFNQELPKENIDTEKVETTMQTWLREMEEMKHKDGMMPSDEYNLLNDKIDGIIILINRMKKELNLSNKDNDMIIKKITKKLKSK